jgi:hypothetical protein
VGLDRIQKQLLDLLAFRWLTQFAGQGGHVILHPLAQLVPEFLRADLQAAGHGVHVEVEHEAADHDRRVVDARRTRTSDLASVHVDVIDRPEHRRNAQCPVGGQNRRHEMSVDRLHPDRRLAVGIHEVEEHLVAVQVDRAAADITADDLQVVLPAIVQIDFLLDILVQADGNERMRWIHQRHHRIVIRLHGFGDGVKDRHRIQRRYVPCVDYANSVHDSPSRFCF